MRRQARCLNYRQTVRRRFAREFRRENRRNSEHDRERSTERHTTHNSDALTITSQTTSRDQLINDVVAVLLLTSGRSGSAHRLVRFARHDRQCGTQRRWRCTLRRYIWLCTAVCDRVRSPACGRAYSSALSSSLKKVHAHVNTVRLQARAS